LDWRIVDAALRTIARKRAALDADEARWLREAEAMQIWREFGMVSMLDYLERALECSSRTAHDRLRVARALGSLPQLTGALAAGALSFCAVRELTRVATPATESAWLGSATGKNLRQIELMVADRRPGDDPSDPPSPEARRHVVRFELSAETFASLRQARTVINDEHGTYLSDDDFVTALCRSVLDGASSGEPTGRAKFQVAVTVCERCRQGWQEGGGAKIAIDPTAVERAMCDAQHIGSIDDEVPGRAYQDIAPSVARLVWRRDGGRCRVPGCGSARALELHHIRHRADGGGHDALNLSLLCGSCHRAHHSGALTITGDANALVVRRAGEAAMSKEPRDCNDVHASRVDRTEPWSAAQSGDTLSEARPRDKDIDEVVATSVCSSARSAAHVGTNESELVAPGVGRSSVRNAAHAGASEAVAPSLGRWSARSAAHVGTDTSEAVAPSVCRSSVRSAAHEAPLPDNHIGDVVAPCVHRSFARRPTQMSAEKREVVTPCAHRSPVRNAAHVGADKNQTDAPSVHRSSARSAAHEARPPGTHISDAVATSTHRSPVRSTAHVGADKNQTDAPSVHRSSAGSARHEARLPGTQISDAVAPSTHRSSARTAHVGTAKLDMAVRREEAKAALIGLGWKSTVAGNAVTQAMATAGPETTLEELIRLALRLCPRPSVA
jgi:hypothetical protein